MATPMEAAGTPPPDPSFERAAALIVKSGVFDLDCYRAAADPSGSLDLAAAITDYLIRGERENFSPHYLFVPNHVRAQLDLLGIPLVDDSVLATYLSLRGEPLDPHPVFDHRYFVRENSALSHLEDYLQRWHCGEKPPSPHVLFDAAFYLAGNPDVAASGAEPFMHYLLFGWREGRIPHPLFRIAHWRRGLAARAGIDPASQDPLTRYCADRSTWSAATHPLFEPAHFNEHLAAAHLEPAVSRPPLADMLLRKPELSGHRLFDAEFYRAECGRLGREFSEHALVHYVSNRITAVSGPIGAAADPHPLFVEAFYRATYPDVDLTGEPALIHFVQVGQAEGRDPNPLFSNRHYFKANPSVPSDERRALEHYLRSSAELLETHALFDARVYAARHPDCRNPGETPLGHYSRTWRDRGWRFPPWGTALHPRRGATPSAESPDVIVVSHELSRTGAPAILLRIVADLVARRGLETLVLAVQGGELLEDFCEWSATVDLSFTRQGGISDATFMEMLARSCDSASSPRLLLINTACVDQAAIRWEGNVPTMTLVHEMASSFPEVRFAQIYANSGVVVYPAEAVRTEAHLHYPLPIAKTAVAPQGLLDPAFGRGDWSRARSEVLAEISADSAAFIVLGCGTGDLRKGIDSFVQLACSTLRAAQRCRAARPPHFVWIGGGSTAGHSEHFYARQDIERSGFGEHIHLLGMRVASEPYFLACDAFVLTSRLDPFPCVIHEAMACGKPIIAFADSGGAAEALTGDAGIVVPYGDIAAMGAELLALLTDPDRAAAYGSRALAAVRERYVFSDYVDRLAALCAERLRVDLGPTRALSARRRPRVVLSCAEDDPESPWQQAQFLTAGLLDRGFDADLICSGRVRSVEGRKPYAPHRPLLPASRNEPTYMQRWDALTRVLQVAAPVVLIHQFDAVAAALAPVPIEGVGVLGVIPSSSERSFEQAARLGRYWQRAVVPNAALAARILDVAPALQGRIAVIPTPTHRYEPPVRRDPSEPLRIVVHGRRWSGTHARPFLVPLLHGLAARSESFVLTVIDGGPETALLEAAAASTERVRVRILDEAPYVSLPGILGEQDLSVLLPTESDTSISIEACMAAGLAVVLADRHPEAGSPFRDGIHGHRARGRLETILETIVALATNRHRLEEMRLAAHEAAKDAPDANDVLDAYAALLAEMIDELQRRSYLKPKPLFTDPVLGALSLPPLFEVQRDRLGFIGKP